MRRIEIPTMPTRYGDTLQSPHTLLYRNKRYAIGAVIRGAMGRMLQGQEPVPGPWAYVYGIATVINGTPQEHGVGVRVEDGDLLVIDRATYAIRGDASGQPYLSPHEIPPMSGEDVTAIEIAGKRAAARDGNVFDDDNQCCADAWLDATTPDPLNGRVTCERTDTNLAQFRRGYLVERKRSVSRRVRALLSVLPGNGNE